MILYIELRIYRKMHYFHQMITINITFELSTDESVLKL